MSSTACEPQVDKLEDTRSERGSVGEEIYKVLCRRIAGIEMPSDLDGRETQELCLGTSDVAASELSARREELPPRLVALAERRTGLVQALDTAFADEVTGDLERMMRHMRPFYDPPEEKIQEGTRVLAHFLDKLVDDPTALEGVAVWGRLTTVPSESAFGMLRAAFSEDSNTSEVLASVLPPLFEDEEALKNALSALAFDMATAEVDPDDEAVDEMRELLSREAEEGAKSFALEEPLLVASRDERGLPVPLADEDGVLPYPFVDDDEDGLADAEGSVFVADSDFEGSIPEPFPVPGEQGVMRQESGMACALEPDGGADCTRALYAANDIDPTLLPAMLRTLSGFFSGEISAFGNLGRAAKAILGPSVKAETRFGEAKFSYEVPPSDASSSVLGLVHAATALMPHAVYDDSLAMFQTLLRDHEKAVVSSIEPVLELERRTRPGEDQYPGTELKKDHLFWDQLLWELEKLSRRRLTAGGETMMEAMTRSMLGYGRDFTERGNPVERQLITPDRLKHQGALLATMMRYRDVWYPNPAGESVRDPSEPLTLGYFHNPVDRSRPDTPVTCGKDGCGGLLSDTPFGPWRPEGDKCVIQRKGRPSSSTDCGEPANQSLFQRSMALLGEVSGRVQCNKAFSIGDLLEFAAPENPCENLTGSAAGSCDQDSDCEGGSDYACDTERGVCIAKAGSTECKRLKNQRNDENLDAIAQAEDALAADYTCPMDPQYADAPCHAYDSEDDAEYYPAAFVDPDGTDGPLEAKVPDCHLFDFPDVGRLFAKVMTGEFEMELPNPWVRRFLLDIARARNPDLPRCADVAEDTRIVEPWPAPPMYLENGAPNPQACVHEAAKLARDLLSTWKNCDDAEYDSDEQELCKREGTTLGAMVEFMLDDSTLFPSYDDMVYLRPNARAISRVLFGGNESNSPESTFALFDPLLLRSAPPFCADAPELPACPDDDSGGLDEPGSCCIENPANPPLRYKLDTYYAATSFAWEHSLKFTDGTELSFLDATVPIADAFNRLDYDPSRPEDFEDTAFMFTALGEVVSAHFDSEDNPFHVYGTGLVKYEEMLADLVDDGTIDYTQSANDGEPLFKDVTADTWPHMDFVYNSFDVLEVMESLEIDGRDGIAVSTEVAEAFLSPHYHCAGETGDRRVIAGEGACSKSEPGFKEPLTYLDGRSHVCWNDGRCFDGVSEYKGETLPLRYPSPVYLTLDPISDIADRAEAEDVRDTARLVLSGIVDAYGKTKGSRLADRTLHSLSLSLMAYSRERWAEEHADGTLEELVESAKDDVVDVLKDPVTGTALNILYAIAEEPGATDAMSKFIGAMLSEGHRPLASWMQDALNSAPGDARSVAMSKVFATTLAENVHEVIAGVDGERKLAIEDGATYRNLELMRESIRHDESDVMTRVMRNVATLTPISTPDGKSYPMAPMYAIWDAVIAVNREDPLSHEPYSSGDYAATMERVSDVLLDERLGFERLYRLMQCASDGDSDACK